MGASTSATLEHDPCYMIVWSVVPTWFPELKAIGWNLVKSQNKQGKYYFCKQAPVYQGKKDVHLMQKKSRQRALSHFWVSALRHKDRVKW